MMKGEAAMKLSIFAVPPSFTSYDQVIDFCVEHRMGGLELFPMLELADGQPDTARRIAEKARENGLEITCFSAGVDLAAEDGVDRVAQLRRYADCAAAAGSPYLHHTLALSLTHSYGPVTFRQLRERVTPRARAVFDYAADLGVQCIYEEQGLYCNGAARFGEFLDGLDRPAGMCLDLGNCLFVDEGPEQLLGFLPLARHVHLKDYLVRPAHMPHPGGQAYVSAAGNYLLELPMGYGSVNFEQVFAMLLRQGYDGWFSTEYFGPGDVQALELSVENVRRYYENARQNAAISGTTGLLSAEKR